MQRKSLLEIISAPQEPLRELEPSAVRGRQCVYLPIRRQAARGLAGAAVPEGHLMCREALGSDLGCGMRRERQGVSRQEQVLEIGRSYMHAEMPQGRQGSRQDRQLSIQQIYTYRTELTATQAYWCY